MAYPVGYVEGSGQFQFKHKKCPHSVMVGLACSLCQCGYKGPSRKLATVAEVTAVEDETEIAVEELSEEAAELLRWSNEGSKQECEQESDSEESEKE